MIANTPTVLDIAAYILSKLGPLPAGKLHKLVYYCQAWSLVWDKRPLFKERIEAWASGPVVPELYASHGKKIVVDEVPGDPRHLDKDARDTVDAVICFYGKKRPQWLSDLIHREAPWKNARQGISEGMKSNVPITLESMAEYYGSLTDKRRSNDNKKEVVGPVDLLKSSGVSQFRDEIVAKAIERCRSYDEADKKCGYAIPRETPLLLHLRTAMSAIDCGISTKNWSVVAEGLVLLAELHERIEAKIGLSM